MDTNTNPPKVVFEIQPEHLPDLAIIGASYIAHLGLDFAKYSDAMIKEFGEAIKPHLHDLFKKSQDQIEVVAEEIFREETSK